MWLISITSFFRTWVTNSVCFPSTFISNVTTNPQQPQKSDWWGHPQAAVLLSDHNTFIMEFWSERSVTVNDTVSKPGHGILHQKVAQSSLLWEGLHGIKASFADFIFHSLNKSAAPVLGIGMGHWERCTPYTPPQVKHSLSRWNLAAQSGNFSPSSLALTFCNVEKKNNI